MKDKTTDSHRNQPSCTEEQAARLRELYEDPDAWVGYWCSDQWGRSSNGGDTDSKWHARTGAVHEIDDDLCLTVCPRGGFEGGLHATLEPHRWRGCRVWIVALFGQRVGGEGKFAARKREVVCEIRPSDLLTPQLAVRMGTNLNFLQGANLQNADLRGASLRWANLQYADLRDADLRGASLRYADLRGADCNKADFQYADLQYADLKYTDLLGTRLDRVHLQRAYLPLANLHDANLHGACLRDANMQGSNMISANLQDVDLRDACLQDVELRGADLRGADLQGADLRGANYKESQFTDEQLEGAIL